MPRVPEVRVRVVRFSGIARTVGVRATTFEGVPGRITTPARTIVDCFRYERLVGPEVAMEALTDALDRRLATVAELTRIERELPSRRLRAALDVRSI
jgi:predicted transcriptional regulator of viral defense system